MNKETQFTELSKYIKTLVNEYDMDEDEYDENDEDENDEDDEDEGGIECYVININC